MNILGKTFKSHAFDDMGTLYVASHFLDNGARIVLKQKNKPEVVGICPTRHFHAFFERVLPANYPKAVF